MTDWPDESQIKKQITEELDTPIARHNRLWPENVVDTHMIGDTQLLTLDAMAEMALERDRPLRPEDFGLTQWLAPRSEEFVI